MQEKSKQQQPGKPPKAPNPCAHVVCAPPRPGGEHEGEMARNMERHLTQELLRQWPVCNSEGVNGVQSSTLHEALDLLEDFTRPPTEIRSAAQQVRDALLGRSAELRGSWEAGRRNRESERASDSASDSASDCDSSDYGSASHTHTHSVAPSLPRSLAPSLPRSLAPSLPPFLSLPRSHPFSRSLAPTLSLALSIFQRREDGGGQRGGNRCGNRCGARGLPSLGGAQDDLPASDAPPESPVCCHQGRSRMTASRSAAKPSRSSRGDGKKHKNVMEIKSLEILGSP